MSKFLVVLGLVALLGQASFAALFSKPEALEDIEWTKAINAKLCEAGTHPDSVAKDFYACYDEKIVPVSNKVHKLLGYKDLSEFLHT